MIKSRIGQFPMLVLLGLFTFAILGISGLSSHAAEASIPLVNSSDDALFVPSAPPDLTESNLTPTNCRYGVAAGYGSEPVDWIDYLGAGHYVNFTVFAPPLPENIEVLPIIKVEQNKKNGQFLPSYYVNPSLKALGPYVAAHPGRLWLVGNEPDVAYVTQNGMYPEWYARAYHDIYNTIKRADPTAQVAIGALSMMTPGRLQYLDIVWNTYLREYGKPMPVDVWNTHLYILSEIGWGGSGSGDGKVAIGTDPALAKQGSGGQDFEARCALDEVYCRSEHDDIDIFIEQIEALRSWMKDHGQQNKPLIITEFSQLYPFVNYDDPVNPTRCEVMDEFGGCFTEQRVSTFLQKAMNYLESAKDPDLGYPADDFRLVQQWTWYSIWTSYRSGDSSNLLVDGFESLAPGSASGLTQVGQAYRDRSKNSQRTINLVAGVAPNVGAEAIGATADVELRVGYFNNGSTEISTPFKVTFYKNKGLTQVIGEVMVTPESSGIINGCSWGRMTEWASVVWEGAPRGAHTFWVKIDSGDQISGETSETDNVTSGKVIIGRQVKLPAIYGP